MTETFRLADAAVTMEPSGLSVTTFRDGGVVKAWPGDRQEDRARAVSLGYAQDVSQLTWQHLVAMSRDHEASHHLLAHWLGLDRSPTLHGVSRNRYWPHWHREEAAALALQAFALAAGVDLLAILRRTAG
ncbi:hypothetical protein [Tianweitania sediminis]|uniref:Uncharacterized protein n=1 Tax=Tianweitania sediminis TaxID=1502156 RepID=A0A8J7UIW6_9HYPH|nr:hypothetical protein [Tianweitania sediminis]MBP0440674.1 hypothetical protein [Tianweitania sediminis]